MRGYEQDLAYIHDEGFSGGEAQAGQELIAILRRERVDGGLVVDLGCGSGRWALELDRAGYRVLGVDQSDAMIELARGIAPNCRFEVASVHDFELPPCDAVTSLGECFNYCFDGKSGPRAMLRLFRHVHAALRPGGVFIFDISGPERAPAQSPHRSWWEGEDWAVLVEVIRRAANTLDRRIISFREVGGMYRRSEEVHSVRLYPADEVRKQLESVGFKVRTLSAFARRHVPAGNTVFLAYRAATARERFGRNSKSPGA